MHISSHSTSYRQELPRRIMLTALQCFQKQGVKAVKMDMIAHQLGVSKRTIYELFSNKEELLYECLVLNHEIKEQRLKDALAKGSNTIDAIVAFYHIQVEELSNTSLAFYQEIEKYERVRNFLQRTHEESQQKAHDFFQRGIDEGLFRNDVNYDIVMQLGNMSLHYVIDSKLYQRYSIQEVFRNILFVFVRGFCTDKGFECLENTLSKILPQMR